MTPPPIPADVVTCLRDLLTWTSRATTSNDPVTLQWTVEQCAGRIRRTLAVHGHGVTTTPDASAPRAHGASHASP